MRVLAFPCNQFGAQEPWPEAEVLKFAQDKYGVTFQMHAKIEVNGAGTHPLYDFLKSKKPGLLGTKAIKWNFTKFLVDPSGRVVARYAPKVSPRDIVGDFTAMLRDK